MDRAVEVTHTADGITLLFDTFSGESKNLLESLKNAGAAFHAAVIEDDRSEEHTSELQSHA